MIQYYDEQIQVLLNEIKIIQYELDYYHTYSERKVLLDKYYSLKDKVKKAFLDYFQYEKENNLPINFGYQKVYKLVFKV